MTIPGSFTEIARHTFCRCYGLEIIIIHNPVTSIREYAFSGCSVLKLISIPGRVFFMNSMHFLVVLVYHRSLSPIHLSSLVYAFNGCFNLKTTFIPEGFDCDLMHFPKELQETSTQVHTNFLKHSFNDRAMRVLICLSIILVQMFLWVMEQIEFRWQLFSCMKSHFLQCDHTVIISLNKLQNRCV